MGKLFAAGKFFGHCIGKNVSADLLTSTLGLFVVTGGPIRVHSIGFMVTTALPAGANTLKFQHTPSGGSATDISAATDTASGGAQQMYIMDGAKATALLKTTDVGILADGQTLNMENIILSAGHIKAVFSGGPPATGAGLFFMEYSPLSHTTKVTVG